MSRLGLSACLAWAGLLSAAVPLGGQAGDQNPAPIRAISADGGYALRFAPGSRNDGFYRVSYQGRLVREKGTPFKSARALDLLAPVAQEAGGDVPAISLRYEDTEAVVGGGLLEALIARELPVSGVSRLGLRGVAQLGADAEFKSIYAAVGLESPPARVPGLAGTGISNWIVVGLNAQRREATDSGAPDVNHALATFRTFVGKAIGWRKSADVGQTAQRIVDEVLELAPTRDSAVAIQARLSAIPAQRRSSLQQTLLDAIQDLSPDDDWMAKVRAMAFGEADAITDQPTLAIYGEWSGWVDLASDPADGRFRSLFTSSVDYWFLPRRDDILLRFRYELGYERAAPKPRKNQLLLAIGLRI